MSEAPRAARRAADIALPIVIGLLVGMIAANIWPIVLLKFGMPMAAGAEALFLAAYVWWVRGGGPPTSWKDFRADNFRVRSFTRAEWLWGLIAAVSFAVTVHAAIVLLFRLVPFPAKAFHAGYDFGFIPSRTMQWLACIVSATSAGICEETGFRGYMQRPLEKQLGPLIAILISSLLFMLLHLTKSWSLIGMVPIVFGAGVLLGTLAWASRSLIFCMIGHILMDIGLFTYWWTQIAGRFSQRPISETGMDQAFYIACGVFAVALVVMLTATARLHRLRPA